MPYKSKEAKREYQKKYRTPYMRRYRAQGKDRSRDPVVETQPFSGRDPVETCRDPGNNPKQIRGLIMEGNRIIGVAPGVETEVIPWYNPALHKPGDRVLVRDFRGRPKTITVPELDADGNPMS